jgi:hypothetical protein
VVSARKAVEPVKRIMVAALAMLDSAMANKLAKIRALLVFIVSR